MRLITEQFNSELCVHRGIANLFESAGNSLVKNVATDFRNPIFCLRPAGFYAVCVIKQGTWYGWFMLLVIDRLGSSSRPLPFDTSRFRN